MKRIEVTAPYLCPAGATIRDAMARVNETPELFQIVVDDRGGFLGTVTDGDIRRALISGCGLDASATACMNTAAIRGRLGDDAGNLRLLGRGRGLIPFLPVCRADGSVAHILVASGAPLTRGTALVMAGGFGQRLGGMTRDVPKPLLNVGDKPILSHLLARIETAGFDEIHVAVHYLAGKFETFLADYQGSAKVRLIVEERPLGTAGAIALLPERPPDPFLVVNADVMTRVGFSAIRMYHEQHDFDGTVATARYEYVVPYGVVQAAENGQLHCLQEKPVMRHDVIAGIYYLCPIFHDLVPPNAPIDMPALLDRARQSGLRVGLFPVHEYWRDIGRPADLAAAHVEHGGQSEPPNPAGGQP